MRLLRGAPNRQESSCLSAGYDVTPAKTWDDARMEKKKKQETGSPVVPKGQRAQGKAIPSTRQPYFVESCVQG
jgi:hypothetical protein